MHSLDGPLSYKFCSNRIPSKYDLNDIKENSDIFREKLKCLKEVKPNEKLYINKETQELSIDPGIMLVPEFFSRWWYEQSRENLLNYFETTISDYVKLLDMIIQAGKQNITSNIVTEIKESNYKFICRIEQGITNLKITYPDYIELHNKIELAIGQFFDFKSLVEKSREPKYDTSFNLNVSID